MLNSFVRTTFKKRFDRWIDKRIPLQTDTLAVHRKSIYILPTKFGFLFGLILTAMLVGSINYEISLGYLLTFLFSAIFFMGMLQSYKNFNTLMLKLLPSKPVFAGEKTTVSFLSTASQQAHNIGISINDYHTHHNLSKDKTISIQLKQKKRGIYTIKKLKLFSIYPLGHFYVWSWLKTELEIIVYPQAKSLNNINLISKNNRIGDNSSQQSGSDELFSFKQYQQGDPIHRIAWKKTAQTGTLHSKEMSKLISDDYYIDWHEFPNVATEERLSLMCYLILQAHNRNELYGLILPNTSLQPDNSEEHKHKCLKELALFNQENET